MNEKLKKLDIFKLQSLYDIVNSTIDRYNEEIKTYAELNNDITLSRITIKEHEILTKRNKLVQFLHLLNKLIENKIEDYIC